MSNRRVLEDDELSAGVAALDGWAVHDGKLVRSFEFADFVTAFGVMTSIALVAEKLGHHPEWTNVYNRVEIALVTHDAGGITELDLQLADRIDRLTRQAPSA